MTRLNRRMMMQLGAGASLAAFGADAALARSATTTAETLAQLTPRMEAAGVAASDIEAIRLADPALGRWTAAWNALGDKHRNSAAALLADGYVQPAGEAYQHAALAYHFGRVVPADGAADTARAEALAARSGADALDLLDPTNQPLDGGVLRYADGAGAAPLVVLVAEGSAAKAELKVRADALTGRGLACLTLDDATRRTAVRAAAADPRIDASRIQFQRA